METDFKVIKLASNEMVTCDTTGLGIIKFEPSEIELCYNGNEMVLRNLDKFRVILWFQPEKQDIINLNETFDFSLITEEGEAIVKVSIKELLVSEEIAHGVERTIKELSNLMYKAPYSFAFTEQRWSLHEIDIAIDAALDAKDEHTFYKLTKEREAVMGRVNP